jgi:hypothetical protein
MSPSEDSLFFHTGILYTTEDEESARTLHNYLICGRADFRLV